MGYLAPSISGQARVISEALDLAGVAPEEVSYIEAHGTGTLIGDPIEIAALVEAFGPDVQHQSCAIGSVKSNIGHAGEAAGMCSLIKTICALEHRELPATLHYQTPNPQADFSASPFFVNASLRPWPVASGKTRIAGVTSLGAGGTNAHLILEEAPRRVFADASGDGTAIASAVVANQRCAGGGDTESGRPSTDESETAAR